MFFASLFMVLRWEGVVLCGVADRAPDSGGAQAGGDGGGECERCRLRTAALPSSALRRLCPFAVYGASVGGGCVVRGGGGRVAVAVLFAL